MHLSIHKSVAVVEFIPLHCTVHSNQKQFRIYSGLHVWAFMHCQILSSSNQEPNDLIKNKGFYEKATKFDNYLLIKKESKIDTITMGNKESAGAAHELFYWFTSST